MLWKAIASLHKTLNTIQNTELFSTSLSWFYGIRGITDKSTEYFSWHLVALDHELSRGMMTMDDFWAHLCVCTVGSYASLSVCLSVTRPKFIFHEPLHLGSWNLARPWTWMTPRSTLIFKVIGQRSRSLGQKTSFEASFDRLTGCYWRSHGSSSKVTRVKVRLKVKG